MERQIATQIVQQHAQAWMTERGFRPMTADEIAEAKAREEQHRGDCPVAGGGIGECNCD